MRRASAFQAQGGRRARYPRLRHPCYGPSAAARGPPPGGFFHGGRGTAFQPTGQVMANVVAICGSLRKGSFNRMLMNASIGLAPEGMTIKEAPSFAKLPIYNFDDQQSTGF